MGFGWIIKSENNIPLTFHGNTILLPSFTKAECFAILTALLVSPSHFTINIFTDSLNCINTFHHITNALTSTRRILKIPNQQIWRTINFLMKKKHLTINFSKIKAHSGDQYNDLADAEAKKGLDVPPITINPKFVPDATMIPMWDSLGPIDRDIRKFAKNITDAKTFDSSRTILLWSLYLHTILFRPSIGPHTNMATTQRHWEHMQLRKIQKTAFTLITFYYAAISLSFFIRTIAT